MSHDARGHERPPSIAVEGVTELLDRHGIGSGDLEVSPIGDGHSNLTFLVQRGDAAVVLRRPPLPPYEPSAHDVLREARILAALDGTGVPVPRVILASEDASLLGVPFYVMEHVEGVSLSDTTPAPLASSAGRSGIGDAAVEALAAVHEVDPAACGLDDLAPPSGYLERQLRRFARIWWKVRTRPLPIVEEIHRWLAEQRPSDAETTLVHGDFRLGNLLIAADPPARVLAVVDWEMATLGDPLADLGYLVATYADDRAATTVMTELCSVTREPGYPDRDELVRRYVRRTGRSAAALRWYEVLALWKSAIFLEASYRRHLDGATDDAWFATFGERLPELAELAWERRR